MLIDKLYDGVEIYRKNKMIFAKLLFPHLVISTCRAGGGLREDVEYVYNHQSCEPKNHMHRLTQYASKYPEKYREIICEEHGLPAERCATLGTAANMNMAGISKQRYRNLEVAAVCTGGVETNGGRIGDTASYYEENGEFIKIPETEEPPVEGTINIMLFINKELSKGAITRSIVTATEAKTAVLQELSVGSCYSEGLATGTGTDQIAVASMKGNDKPLTGAGKHSKLGELIGKSVYSAIKQTLSRQNGLLPENQCSVVRVLSRLGVNEETIIREVSRTLTLEERKLLRGNFVCIERDPVTVSAVAAVVHIRDQIKWGILPACCLPEILGNHLAVLASSVSNRFERTPYYLEILSPIVKSVEKDDFLKVVFRAMAEGFIDKWNG